jgi:hypothetical protein
VAGLLGTVITALEDAGIPYMLTGSMAAAWHGAGRATLDIDLVIDPSAERLRALVGSLARPGLYCSAAAASEALEGGTMFNVVDVATGWKADLIIRKRRPFSETEFSRRSAVDFDGLPLWVASVEDVILSKLEWARLGGSARQLEDVASLVRAAASLDVAYLERWIGELSLHAEWERAQRLLGGS